MKKDERAIEALRRSQPDLDIVTEGALLEERGHDWWMRSLIQRRGGERQRAGAVVRPASAQQAAAVLAWAQETRTAVVP